MGRDPLAVRQPSLFGRRPELERVEGALENLDQGRGSLVFLVGEPGIGKTSLAEEVGAQASRRGVGVAWGRSWDAGGAPAYWPWTQILERLLAGRELDPLIEVLADSASALRALVPAFRSRVPPAAAEPEPERARFALFQAMATLLRWRTATEPLLLVLDDLHAADHASLLLLEFLARDLRNLRLILLGCYRDVEADPAPEIAATLTRTAREGTRLLLRRLDHSETAAMVEQAAGDLGTEAIRAVFEATRGNPLFISETVRLIASEPDTSAGHVRVYFGVREVIRRRLRVLNEDTRAALEVASVIGEQFSLALLGEGSGQVHSDLVESLAPATAAGVLAELPNRRYRFSHALIREVVYRDLPGTRRLELHAVIGRGLERLHPDDSDAPLAEMAHHFLEACPTELEAGPRYALRAAAQALDGLAWEDAAALLERALAALELAPASGQLRGEVLLALGLSRIRGGQTDTGKRLCMQAADLARRQGDGAMLARAALFYGEEIVAAAVDPSLIRLLQEAQARLPQEESALQARVKARLAAALQPAEQPQAPIALAREAIAIARGLADKRTLLEVLHNSVAALMDYVPADERLPLNLEQESLATELGDRIRALRANQRLVIDHLERGELTMMEVRIAACERLANQIPRFRQHWRFLLFRGLRAGFEGRFAEAEDLASQAEAVALQNEVAAQPSLVMHRYALLRTAERFEEALALEPTFLSAWAGLRVTEHFVTIIAAATHARSGDLAGARARLMQIPSTSFVLGHDEPCSMAELADVSLALGEQERLKELYPHLLPLRGRIRCVGLAAPYCDGVYDSLLGRMSIALGRVEEGLGHLEAAEADLTRLGGLPALARVQFDLACALQARGRPEDVERATTLLSAAAATAATLPLPALLAAVRSEQQRLPSETGERPPGSAEPRPVPELTFDLRREGELWSVSSGGQVARFKDSRSMRTLGQLIASPDREFHVLDLVSPGEGTDPGDWRDIGDSGELLDQEARARYRNRLLDLRETLAEAESLDDELRASRAREEIEVLSDELARAVGLGGRDRRGGAAAERARVAVQRRIRDAIRRIQDALPEVGRHLDWAVRTGSFCCYRPRGPR
jgi:hypothetical protein